MPFSTVLLRANFYVFRFNPFSNHPSIQKVLIVEHCYRDFSKLQDQGLLEEVVELFYSITDTI